jgi:hypothetical protein
MDNGIILFILDQSFGIIALLCTVISMQLKKKHSLMVFQTASEAFVVAQYVVKGAITGSCLAAVGFFRDLIFTKYGKKRAPLWVLLVIYALMTGLTALSWAGPLSILPFSGSIVYAFTLWYGKVKWIRFGNAVGNSPYLIYTLITGNYALFLMTLLEVISATVGFIRIDILGKRKKKGRRR